MSARVLRFLSPAKVTRHAKSMWFSLRSALIRTAALIGLGFVCGSASAYPATSSYGAQYNNGGSLGPVVGTAAAACSSGPYQPTYSCGELPATGGTCRSAAACGGYTVYNWQRVSTLTCPNGGTLSGSTCVCGAGETDTGTACVVPACPAGEYRRLPGGACEAKCPAGQGNGPASHPANGASGFCMDKQEFVAGVGWVDGATTGALPRCKYHGVGISVCADYGDGVSCYSEQTYGTGTECSTETTVPDVVTECAAGDLWCKNTGGGCATGFVAGTFNGENLCIKTGNTVTVTPRGSSALDPLPSTPTPPSTLPGSSGSSTPVPSDGGSVIAIGPRASTVGGVGGSTGTGGGSGGTGEDVECGLPGMPKCQIDETGTPTSGNFTDGTSKLGTAVDAMKGVVDEAAKSAGKDTGWKISFGTPSGCTNPAPIVLPHVTWQPDLCAYESQIHSVMSFLWILLTLGSCLAMIRGTATGGV